eukprot:1767884-Rhodomonas_salina.1
MSFPRQQQTISAPQSDVNFKDALTTSLTSQPPRARLTTEDVGSNLQQPGHLTKLLKKVNGSNEKRIKRGSACRRCRVQKRRCDGSFPCGMCLIGGETCEKQDEVNGSSPSPATVVSRGSSLHNQQSESSVASALAVANLEARHNGVAVTVFSPENPMPYPDDPFAAWSRVLPDTQPASAWPKTLVFMFKTVRSSDHFYQRVMNDMTPKLRSTILSVFRGIDDLFHMSGTGEPAPPVPEAPKEWAVQSRLWQDSFRCGRQTIRYDRNFGIVSGVHVNKFWSDLAGLHMEEFNSRSVAGDALSPTSELRQTCKLISLFKLAIQGQLEAKATGKITDVKTKPTFMRFSRDWGRHDRGEGVLLRMDIKSTLDPQMDWTYATFTAVEVTAEEYEAARRVDP